MVRLKEMARRIKAEKAEQDSERHKKKYYKAKERKVPPSFDPNEILVSRIFREQMLKEVPDLKDNEPLMRFAMLILLRRDGEDSEYEKSDLFPIHKGTPYDKTISSHKSFKIKKYLTETFSVLSWGWFKQVKLISRTEGQDAYRISTVIYRELPKPILRLWRAELERRQSEDVDLVRWMNGCPSNITDVDRWLEIKRLQRKIYKEVQQ